MFSKEKIVHFHQYCHLCKHFSKEEEETPCNDCLGCPVNEYSHKPVKYEEDPRRVMEHKKRRFKIMHKHGHTEFEEIPDDCERPHKKPSRKKDKPHCRE